MGNIFTSYKTSLSGLLAIGFGAYLLSIGQTSEGMASISSGLGLLCARDNNVTSEQAGAK
jgi:hypothetical protein